MSFGSLLSPVLIRKVPLELQLILSREIGDGSWKFDDLLQRLHDEIAARERLSTVAAHNDPRPSKSLSTGATLLTSSHETTCCYCQRSHPSHMCKSVSSVEDRRSVLRDSGRCFICLKKGHISRRCRSNSHCQDCRGRHHISICAKKTETEGQSPATNPSSTKNVPSRTTPQSQNQSASSPSPVMNPAATPFHPPKSTSLWINGSQAVLLQTARALVHNPDSPHLSRRARIVFDSGSQRSYITDQLKEELSLCPRGEQSMSIVTFGAQEEIPQVCEIVDLCVMLRGGSTRQLTLYAVPNICEPLTCQPIAFCRDNFEHLSGLPLADTTDSHDRLQIDILLGSDYYWTLLTGEVKRGSSGPVGVQTELGWVLSGPVDTPTQEHNQTTLVTHTLHVENLAQTTESKVLDQLKSFWELESFGITNSERSVLDSFQNGISFVDGRYEVCLPWKNQDQVIPDNYQLCLRRLWALLRRLRDKPEILREYNSIIHTQRESGIVEYVTEPAPVHTSRIHYLAHHAVVRHDKKLLRFA